MIVSISILCWTLLSAAVPSSEHYSLLPGYFLGQIADGILPPENVTISTDSESIFLFWDAVPGATGYAVHSSDEPYAGFMEDLTGTFDGESWSAPLPLEKRFYYVVALR